MSDVTVPPFPESVTEGTLLAWRKKPGEAVGRGEVLADIETDKVVFEVPAADDGMLTEIVVPEGSTVVSGQVIARLGPAAGARRAPTAAEGAEPVPSQKAAVMPAARKLMAEHGISAGEVAGSGKDGRVLKEDVLRAVESRRRAATTETAPRAAEPAEPPTGPVEAPALPGERPERRVPMTRLRARIAERLVQAQHTAAMLTTFNEVNMQPVMELRRLHGERFKKEHDIKLGLMSFFAKAAVEALKRFPEVNASIDGRDVVYHGYYDIGIAVSTPRGLVVPILRDVDQMSMAEIERRIDDYARRAETGRLTLEEITGGTFTITNGGVFGSLLSTPILNPPQSAILGMHRIQERPVAESGQVAIRPMMYLALSYDHRLIDGREAVLFLVTIKEVLEDPARLLLEV